MDKEATEYPECDLGTGSAPPEPAVIVIFGATGDLALRKIFPALFNLATDGLLPPETRILGFARREWTDDDFRAAFLDACEKYSRQSASHPSVKASVWSGLRDRISYLRGDLNDPEAYGRLKVAIEGPSMPANALFYLAVGPDLFAVITERLATAGLGSAHRAGQDGRPEASGGAARGERRIIVEKPFGRDRASSRSLSRFLQERFAEKDIFRIDHYLGKETVQNLLYLRFANSIFEPLWNRNHIESIAIDVFETGGIGSRGGYYDTAGAARDMLQNHLVQLLCLIAMEPPSNLDPESIRDEKVKVLKAIPDYSIPAMRARSVRGQYTASLGADGRAIAAYREEDKVASDSMTETFAGLRIELDNWRFSGVPITLRTGKSLDHVSSEITVQFKRPPATLFAEHCGDRLAANRLTVRIQPDDGVWLSFNAKVPGAPRIRKGNLSFSYSRGGDYVPEAYERLLADALAGDSTLFIRADESDEAWRIIDTLEAAWAESGAMPLVMYPSGSAALEIPGNAAPR